MAHAIRRNIRNGEKMDRKKDKGKKQENKNK